LWPVAVAVSLSSREPLLTSYGYRLQTIG